MAVRIEDIDIRGELRPGDLGAVIQMHAELYVQEYGFGPVFETYVAEGLCEFRRNYDPALDRVWICEHGGGIVGTLFLMHRDGGVAQLRYFLIRPEYRGVGLGKLLMGEFMGTLRQRGYRSAYLWTTHELAAAASLYKRHGFRLTKEKESTAFGRPTVEQRYDLEPVR